MTKQLLVVVLEALGEVFDILGRPAGHFHAEVQAHLRQHFFLDRPHLLFLL